MAKFVFHEHKSEYSLIIQDCINDYREISRQRLGYNKAKALKQAKENIELHGWHTNRYNVILEKPTYTAIDYYL